MWQDHDRQGQIMEKVYLGLTGRLVCLHVELVGLRFLRFLQSWGGLVPESDIRDNLDLGPILLNIKRKKTNHHRYKVDCE